MEGEEEENEGRKRRVRWRRERRAIAGCNRSERKRQSWRRRRQRRLEKNQVFVTRNCILLIIYFSSLVCQEDGNRQKDWTEGEADKDRQS